MLEYTTEDPEATDTIKNYIKAVDIIIKPPNITRETLRKVMMAIEVFLGGGSVEAGEHGN
jgi:hypothetical protein